MFSVFSLFRFVNLCLLSSSRLVVLCFFRWQIWWWRVTTVAVEEMDVVDQLAGSVGSGSGSAGPSRFGWIWICCWGEGRRLWGSGDDGRKQWWRGLGLVLSGEGEWGGKIVWLKGEICGNDGGVGDVVGRLWLVKWLRWKAVGRKKTQKLRGATGWLEKDGFRVRVFMCSSPFQPQNCPPESGFFFPIYREKNHFFSNA